MFLFASILAWRASNRGGRAILWDSMEEWGQIEYTFTQPYTPKERVFWHLLHQVHYWPEDKLAHDTYLIEELTNCVLF